MVQSKKRKDKICRCGHGSKSHNMQSSVTKMCMAHRTYEKVIKTITEDSGFCYCMEYDGDSFEKMIEDLSVIHDEI